MYPTFENCSVTQKNGLQGFIMQINCLISSDQKQKKNSGIKVFWLNKGVFFYTESENFCFISVFNEQKVLLKLRGNKTNEKISLPNTSPYFLFSFLNVPFWAKASSWSKWRRLNMKHSLLKILKGETLLNKKELWHLKNWKRNH